MYPPPVTRWSIASGDVVQLVRASDRCAVDRRFDSPMRQGIFLPESTFSADSLTVSVRTSPCAVACIYIYAHVTDLVVHVRVWWIMETLKHPACTGGWVVRLCRSWLSPGKATQISRGRKPIWTIHLYSCKKYFKKEKEQKKLQLLCACTISSFILV